MNIWEHLFRLLMNFMLGIVVVILRGGGRLGHVSLFAWVAREYIQCNPQANVFPLAASRNNGGLIFDLEGN
jgi:hypothetical protein